MVLVLVYIVYRTVASDVLDTDVDLVTVQKLLGHANVQTNAQYDRRNKCTWSTSALSMRRSFHYTNRS
jgi:site-specific recombinase XerD